MKTYVVDSCPGCGHGEAADLFLGDHRLRRCTRCELVHAAEYGDPDEIYVAGYLKGESDFGLDVFDPLFQEFLVWAGHQRVAQIEKAATKGSFLDVGCGSGEVLLAARERGWEVAGAEPVAESAQIAQERGLDVRHAMLEEAELPERSFDVVAGFHVLEHMRDGAAFLRLLARWVKPGGHVAVEVPNWESRHRRVWDRQWNGLRHLEHIAHYGPVTLAATARQAGLEPVRVRTYGFLWPKQNLNQMLADLGMMRWEGRLNRLTRPSDVPENPGRRPNAAALALLRAAHVGLTARGRNQGLLGVFRVP